MFKSPAQLIPTLLPNSSPHSSPTQSSGYLLEDVQDVGLLEICKRDWTWRYISPGQDILKLDLTCSNLAGDEAKLKFIVATGGVSDLEDVQTGAVTAFEYATALNNFEEFFPPHIACNAQLGLAQHVAAVTLFHNVIKILDRRG